MADQHIEKKRKVVPPAAPWNHASRLSAKPSDHSRARSVSDAKGGHTPSSGKSTPSTRSYPTPEPTVRKSVPRANSLVPRSNRVLAPDFETTTTPRSVSQNIADSGLSDSEDAMIIEKYRKSSSVAFNASYSRFKPAPKGKRKEKILPSDLDDEDDGPSVNTNLKAKKGAMGNGKAAAEFSMDEGLDGDDEGEGEGEGEGKGEGEGEGKGGGGGEDEGEGKGEDEDEDSTAASSTKVEAEDIVGGHKKHIIGVVVRNRILDLCGIDQAQHAHQIKPQFDALGKPKHIVDNLLVPHLDSSFKVEWGHWGGKLLKVVRDMARLSPEEQTIVLSATDQEIREAVRIGVWATMVRVWKQYRKGVGEAWSQKRKDSSRNLGYRNQKAKNRLKALETSGLNVGSFKSIVDPYFQSDEETDPLNESRRIVKVPEYRTEDCNDFLAALDVAFNGKKGSRGNQKCTEFHYVKVNVKVPKLKSVLDVPRWAISQTWERANPELELESRQFINPKQTNIPQTTKFREFLHRYKAAKQREYQGTPSAATPVLAAAAPVDSEPELAGPVAIEEFEPVAEPVSVGRSSLVDPLSPAPLPTPVHAPASKHWGSANPPTFAPVGLSVEHSTLTSIGPRPLAPFPTPPHPPNHEFVAQPPAGPNFGPVAGQPYTQLAYNQVAPGPQPGFPPFSYPPQAPGHLVPMQLPDGRLAWIVQPSAPPQFVDAYGQGDHPGTGVHNPSVDFQIDPGLNSGHAQPLQSNTMPPPPEIIHSAPQIPEDEESAPPVKATNERGRGRGGKGKGAATSTRATSTRGRRRKSKAIIEDEDDGEETDKASSVAGPSQLPLNAGKPSSLRLKVKGT